MKTLSWLLALWLAFTASTVAAGADIAAALAEPFEMRVRLD